MDQMWGAFPAPRPQFAAGSHAYPARRARGKLLACSDVELGEDVPEVGLHRPLGDEQALGDLPVRPALGGHARDPELAGGQRLDTGEDRLAGPPACCEEFLAGQHGERGRGRAMSELQTLPEMVLFGRPRAPPVRAART